MLRIAIDLGAVNGRRFQHFRDELLHHRAFEVRQQSIRVGVGFYDAAALAIRAQVPFIADGTGFVRSVRNHLLCGFLEGIELPLVDREFDQKIDVLWH